MTPVAHCIAQKFFLLPLKIPGSSPAPTPNSEQLLQAATQRCLRAHLAHLSLHPVFPQEPLVEYFSSPNIQILHALPFNSTSLVPALALTSEPLQSVPNGPAPSPVPPHRSPASYTGQQSHSCGVMNALLHRVGSP